MSAVRDSWDVVVIGGGVVGLAVAWRAARRGLRVAVLERGELGGGTSRHAAGMLAPIAEVTPGEEALLHLGLASARLYPRFVDELLEQADVTEVGYTRNGTLLVARDADEAEALERELSLRHRFGLEVTRLRSSQARRLEPGLAPALRLALDVPGDHAIDPRKLVGALGRAVPAAGGVIRTHTCAAAVDTAAGRVTGVVIDDGTAVAARRVVVAAGVWASAIAGIPAEARMPLRPVKGQIMRLHDPAGPGLLHRVVRMGTSYITPRGDGRYVVGATSEERGFDTTVTAGAALGLLRDASELVPGILELVVDEFTAGLRPGTPDNLPAIGAGAIDGLSWAVGHRRNGILLAPVTAEIVVAGLLGEEPPVPVADVAPERFLRQPAGSAAV